MGQEQLSKFKGGCSKQGHCKLTPFAGVALETQGGTNECHSPMEYYHVVQSHNQAERRDLYSIVGRDSILNADPGGGRGPGSRSWSPSCLSQTPREANR